MKSISHIAFAATMFGIVGLGLVAFSTFGYVIERDIVELSLNRPQVQIRVPSDRSGRVAGVSVTSVGEMQLLIDDQIGDPLDVTLPVVPDMTLDDVMRQVTTAFDLGYETVLGSDDVVLVRTIGTTTNGMQDSYWHFTVNGDEPVGPINALNAHSGDVVRFFFEPQSNQQ